MQHLNQTYSLPFPKVLQGAVFNRFKWLVETFAPTNPNLKIHEWEINFLNQIVKSSIGFLLLMDSDTPRARIDQVRIFFFSFFPTYKP